MPLGSGLLEEGDQVRSVLGLLQPSEHLYTPPRASSAPPLAAVLDQRKRSTGGEWQKQARSQRQSKLPCTAAGRAAACIAGDDGRWRSPKGRAEEGRRTILVPGMYAFGLSRYMYRCSSHHVMPVAKRR